MRPQTRKFLLRFYPRAWRQRYGEELEALLENSNEPFDAVDILRGAFKEQILSIRGAIMTKTPYTFSAIAIKPTAFVPFAMSCSALLIVFGAIAYSHAHPAPPDGDEGAIAHLWQLLMTVQLPVVLFFAVKWLRRAPRPTLAVLALQAAAWLASCAPIYLLHL